MVKSLPANVGDMGLIPRLEDPLEENGNPLQYSCLENFMDRGAWWATVPGVSKCQTQLSMYHVFIHSSVSGHLRCFHMLAVINSATVSVGKCII